MAKNGHSENGSKTDKKVSGSIATQTSAKRHPLNVPMKKSEMSEADKATMRAWKYTYANRDKRVD